MDKYTSETNKKMDEDEKREKELNHFVNNFSYKILDIKDIIKDLKTVAKKGYSYDFTEDLNDMIKEIV